MNKMILIFTTCLIGTTMSANGIVARVIFSEASEKCENYERFLIASVIMNRINHPGFGKLKTMEQVVLQKNAFECVNDSHNSNWNRSELIDPKNNQVMYQCLLLERGTISPYKDITMYFDKSIKQPPKNWTSKAWKVVKVLETEHFVFFKVVKA